MELGKISTSFCEQKEAKKLYGSGAGDLATYVPPVCASIKEIFCFFFPKKKFLLK
jgi:hypothetical protein